MSDIRLVLSDVDGTLITNDHRITPATRQAALKLRAAGIALAVVSSRPPRGMAMLVEPLGLDSIIAGFNGGVLARADFSVIESHGLDPLAAACVLDLIASQAQDAWLYTAKDWLVHDMAAPHVEREARAVQFPPELVSSFSQADLADCVKIVGVSDDPTAMTITETIVKNRLGGRVSATCSQAYYLDVTHPLANKGAAIIRISELLGIPLSAIATIGDGPNDVLMFQQSGLAIAMGNANVQVKSHAHLITETNQNDGFAAAVNNYILK